MTHTNTKQEQAEFEAWKEDYALTFEPNYNEHLEADCKAAFLAGMQAARRARDPVDSVQEDDDIDAVALARYKVVPAHESMFHRFAVVAGDGKQQLYLGREVECENMARKFAGAFLDGAFYQANITLPYDIARFAGSISINGATYIVAPNEEGQPLVRQDVLMAEAKARKEGEKK